MSGQTVASVATLFEPTFDQYAQSPKRPTSESIERLENQHGHPTKSTDDEVRFYLAEVRVGVLTDAFTEPPVFPAVRTLYVSKTGLLVQDTYRAIPTDDGELDPVVDLKPSVTTCEANGQLLSRDALSTYSEILERVHGVKPTRPT
jgi:hypothetical protein